MTNKFDEFTRSMAQAVTRRAMLKRFGLGLAGVALAGLLAFPATADDSPRRQRLRLAVALAPGAPVDQTISATLADTLVAPRLKVRVGSPLLSVTRTVADQNGRPVEYINILYRPDRYQYRMKLARVQGIAAKLWSPTA